MSNMYSTWELLFWVVNAAGSGNYLEEHSSHLFRGRSLKLRTYTTWYHKKTTFISLHSNCATFRCGCVWLYQSKLTYGTLSQTMIYSYWYTLYMVPCSLNEAWQKILGNLHLPHVRLQGLMGRTSEKVAWHVIYIPWITVCNKFQ
jgi:hypothetical protein